MRIWVRVTTDKLSRYGPDKNEIVLVAPIYRRPTEWEKTSVVWSYEGNEDLVYRLEPTDYEVVDVRHLQEAAKRLWNECFKQPWFLGVGVADHRLVLFHTEAFPGRLAGPTFMNCPIELRQECSFFIPAVLAAEGEENACLTP